MKGDGKKAAAIVGIASGAVALVLAVLLVMAMTAKGKAVKKLNGAKSAVGGVQRMPDGYAQAAADDAEAVRARCAKRLEEGRAMSPERAPMDRSQFSNHLSLELQTLRDLKNDDTPVASQEQQFGFEGFKYGEVSEGKDIEDKDLPMLQRRLDHVVYMVTRLVEAGAIKIDEVKEIVQDEDAGKDEGGAWRKTLYSVKFAILAPDFGKVLEKFADAGEGARFTTVEKMSFAPVDDSLEKGIGERNAPRKDEKQASGGTRPAHRARGAARGAAPSADEAEKSGPAENKYVVHDDSALNVAMTLSFCEFGVAQADAGEPAAKDDGEGAQ